MKRSDWKKTAPRGLSPTDKEFPMSPDMIERRLEIAKALGYVVRNPCSFNAPGVELRVRFDCLESSEMKHTHDGHPCAGYHAVCERKAGEVMIFPDDVVKAAWSIDKGKPMVDPEAAPPDERQGSLSL